MSYLFPNFNSTTIEVWEWIRNYTHSSLCVWLLAHDGIKRNRQGIKGAESMRPQRHLLSAVYIQASWKFILTQYLGCFNTKMPRQSCRNFHDKNKGRVIYMKRWSLYWNGTEASCVRWHNIPSKKFDFSYHCVKYQGTLFTRSHKPALR